MALPFNIIDGILAILLPLTLLMGYWRGIFASTFDLLRLAMSFLLSLLLYLPVVNALVAFSNFSQSQIALIVQLFVFIAVWFLAGNLRRFFDSTVVATVGKLSVFYRSYKYAGVIPALFTWFIVSIILFAIPLSFPPGSKLRQLAVDSWWGNTIAAKTYAFSVRIGEGYTFAPYNGFLYRLSKEPATFLDQLPKKVGGVIFIDEAKYQYAYELEFKINQERKEKGLAELPPAKLAPIEQQPSPLPVINHRATPTSHPTSTPIPKASPTATPRLVGMPKLHPSLKPTPTPTATPLPTTIANGNPVLSDQEITTMEQAVVTLTNAERQKVGLGTLTGDQGMAAVAKAHSKDMATRHFFSHTTPEGITFDKRLQLGGVSFTSAAENIAINFNAEAVVAAWMNSPGHRTNILHGGYTRIGLGIWQGSEGLYFTQDFAN